MLKNIVLFSLLFAASYKDVRERRIPNKLTFPIILIGWLLGIFSGGFAGLFQSFLGTIAGLAVFFLPFVLGGMGAGDVKLLGAIGSLMGWKFVLYSALYSSISGLIMSLIVFLGQGKFKKMVNNMLYLLITMVMNLSLKYTYNKRLIRLQEQFAKKRQGYEKTYIPYGVAISVGAFLVWLNAYVAFLPF